ncbi:hypothetical protein [Deinococcus sp.]|uniref:hypothetical protein n=1 Tax=Deinococcus sp. TaxID=47478 RepID=UPI003C7D462C
MNQQTFPISSTIQGMACPAPDCPGHLKLWNSPSEDAYFLICDERDASWAVKEQDSIDQSFFEASIGEALERESTKQDLFRVLDHRQFYITSKEFSLLVLEAWKKRTEIVEKSSRQYAVIVPMERIIGRRGERWIEVQYNAYTDQIVGLEPVYY